ncbi:hypothetical protein J2129_000746 [Methanofollis sp. W23]|uniref:SIR2 family protein n=1 Tax=Methanofollis sp. W23 TaxID=2817849 RepID=UPI001AE3AD5E|nr:SIR2 family protein [Methanofollis sp. W23]MBP2145292.1 hypothetical protein [Methanofollis sp. W23]
MIPDDLLPTAFAVVSSPKRYALFLGSGISKTAKIPTGWEITENMIKKIAATSQEQIDGDPVAWYRERSGTEPTFSGLFEDLKASREDQGAVLREYFTFEGEDGERVAPEPTEAHRTIARMVRDGLVGLVITTNFDDLLERALRDAGVQPTVITEGSEPVKMSMIPDHCRIVKVNGDYPNTPLKMTPADLASYTPELEDYLDRILSEYGLIVCGWSAKDDTGLVNILAGKEGEKERVRRYSVYWCQRKDSGPLPEAIMESLHPSIIEIASADEFFGELHSRIEVLRRYEQKEKMSVSTAVQKVKKILRKMKPEIVLPDLIHKETDRLLAFIANKRQYNPAITSSKDLLKQILKDLEEVTAPLAAMVATVAYYDNNEHVKLVSDTIERLVHAHNIPVEPVSVDEEFKRGLSSLQHYPAVLVIYCAGIAAVRNENFNMLEAVLRKPKKHPYNGLLQDDSIFKWANVFDTISFDTGYIDIRNSTRDRHYITDNYPDSPYEEMHTIIRSLIPNQFAFSRSLDVFEYIFGLAYIADSRDEEIERGAFRMSTPGPLRSQSLYQRRNPLYGSISPLPPHIFTYLADLQQKAKGSNFFGGNLSAFEEANRKYAMGFEIECPRTGIKLEIRGGLY